MIMNPFLKLPDIGYDKNLIALDKTDKGIVATYKDGSTKDVSIGEAIHAIVSAQTYFLLHSDKKPAALETISHPEDIIDKDLTYTDTTFEVKPLLSAKETEEYLSWLSMGLCAFTNKKSRADKIFKGIGYTIYALYAPFKDTNEKEVHNTFLKLITKSTCILQFSRKPLARALYLGLYSIWPEAVDFHDEMFYKGNPKHKDMMTAEHLQNDYRCEGYFDDLFKNKDIYYEPTEGLDEYPYDTKNYSIDNIILSGVAIVKVKRSNDKLHFLTDKEAEFISNAYDAVRVFLFKVISMYKHCADGNSTWYCIDPKKDPLDENPLNRVTVHFREWIKDNMNKYFFGISGWKTWTPPLLPRDSLPYVYYSVITLGQGREWPFLTRSSDLASKIAHKPKIKLDLDKPILYEREAIEQKKVRDKENLPNNIILLLTGIAFLAMILIVGSLLNDLFIDLNFDGSIGYVVAFLFVFGPACLGLGKAFESGGSGFIYGAMYWNTHSSFWWS